MARRLRGAGRHLTARCGEPCGPASSPRLRRRVTRLDGQLVVELRRVASNARCIHAHHVMTSRHHARPYEIYPAFCNTASPTFNRWVKLTAADVHGLRPEPDFQGQNVYFHLNHPIRYVYLVGVVSTIEYIGARIVIMTLDDGSGESIDIKLDRISPPKPFAGSYFRSLQTTHEQGPPEHENDTSDHDSDDNPFETDAIPDTEKKSSWSIQRMPALNFKPVHPETTVANIKVTASCSEPLCDDRQHIMVDNQPLRVGALIKAKGTLTTFRCTMQLVLQRASLVLAADEEARIWEEYTDFVMRVLRHPWSLTNDNVAALESASHVAARREAQAQREERKREQERADKVKMRRARAALAEERAERKRQAMAAELDGNPLDRPGWQPWPEVEQRHAEAARARRKPKLTTGSHDDLRVQTLRQKHGSRQNRK